MIVDHYTYSEAPGDVAVYESIREWDPDSFPPPAFLPKMGVVVWDDDELVCFLCADMSNSIPRAFLDYLMTNPAIGKIKRFKAVKMAEEFICELLRGHGYSNLVGVTPKAGIAMLAQRMGFTLHNKPVLAFGKSLT